MATQQAILRARAYLSLAFPNHPMFQRHANRDEQAGHDAFFASQCEGYQDATLARACAIIAKRERFFSFAALHDAYLEARAERAEESTPALECRTEPMVDSAKVDELLSNLVAKFDAEKTNRVNQVAERRKKIDAIKERLKNG